jgi:hypothetical protein
MSDEISSVDEGYLRRCVELATQALSDPSSSTQTEQRWQRQ